MRKQLLHVEQLTDIARLVIQNPSLQEKSVASILRTCLRQAVNMQNLLEKVLVADKDGHLKKIQKSFAAVMKVKDIGGLLDNLELA